MQETVCKFVRPKPVEDVINTLHFVYETTQRKGDVLHADPMYRFHVVAHGKGTLHTLSGSYSLEAGDVFVTFPSMQYSIDADEDFHYMFISFLGLRGNKIMGELNITKYNCVFYGYHEILPVWKNFLETATSDTTDLFSESALLYAFAVLSTHMETRKKEETTAQNVLAVKKYIDSSYQDAGLTLEHLGRKFNYNPHYLSTLFQKETGISIQRYITSLRMQNACSLMEHGLTSIRDIAFLCGYSDPLYFSKAFKKEMHVSPRIFIAEKKWQHFD